MQLHGLLDEGAAPNEEQWAHLEELAARVQATLQMALQIGRVVIVTNAMQGWVELSCAAFMDSIRNSLQQVDIVSARSAYEPCSQDPSEWKRLAFASEVEGFYESNFQRKNIVSFGDSLHEQHALVSVTRGVPNCCGKSIKLLETPTVDKLIEQHKFLHVCFFDVLEHNGDLDVEIGPEDLI